MISSLNAYILEALKYSNYAIIVSTQTGSYLAGEKYEAPNLHKIFISYHNSMLQNSFAQGFPTVITNAIYLIEFLI